MVKHMRRGVVLVAAFRSNHQSGKSHRARAPAPSRSRFVVVGR